MTLEHFLNGPNRKCFESRKNAEIARNSVKNGLFQPSKHQNSVIFQDIHMTFCTHIYLTWFFHIYTLFENSKKNPQFLKIIFLLIIFQSPSITKILKIRDSSLMETFILNLLLRANHLSLLNCLHDTVSHKYLFLPKNGKR